MFESSPDLSVATVAEIVRLALAPVLLLSGIGAFLNVLAARLSRIVDRSRDIEPMLLASRGAEHDRWISDLKVPSESSLCWGIERLTRTPGLISTRWLPTWPMCSHPARWKARAASFPEMFPSLPMR